jgi:hypothetical protein
MACGILVTCDVRVQSVPIPDDQQTVSKLHAAMSKAQKSNLAATVPATYSLTLVQLRASESLNVRLWNLWDLLLVPSLIRPLMQHLRGEMNGMCLQGAGSKTKNSTIKFQNSGIWWCWGTPSICFDSYTMHYWLRRDQPTKCTELYTSLFFFYDGSYMFQQNKAILKE